MTFNAATLRLVALPRVGLLTDFVLVAAGAGLIAAVAHVSIALPVAPVPVTGRSTTHLRVRATGDLRRQLGNVDREFAVHDLEPGTAMQDVDRVFMGSCTNARSRICAWRPWSPASGSTGKSGRSSCRGRRRSSVSPRKEGLDRIFRDGFEWRRTGCSMFLDVNPDVFAEGERCAPTWNRDFESRQGRGGRTHLVSPQLAAATAIAGHFVDPRELVATA